MPLSMTGYGRAEEVLHGRDITVEIRSVNSRYFEYSSRIPRSCAFMDDRLKKLVGSRVSRGKVELSLQMQELTAQDTVVEPNLELAASYRAALAEIGRKLALRDSVTAQEIARFPDVLVVRRRDVDEDELWADVSSVCEKALEAFVSMRTAEGEKLKKDLLQKLDTVEAAVQQVEQNSEGRVEAYTQRLYTKLKVLLEDRNIDDARILTEAGIFADKTAVDEETVRLHSHLQQYRSILDSTEPIGRKLDFLTQELNRETNTIGSKCQDLEITRIVVEMKSEIEKIREQLQNIE